MDTMPASALLAIITEASKAMGERVAGGFIVYDICKVGVPNWSCPKCHQMHSASSMRTIDCYGNPVFPRCPICRDESKFSEKWGYTDRKQIKPLT